MTSPLNTFVGIQFIIDPAGTTPPENVTYDQRIAYLPPEYMTALGSGPSNPGVLDSIPGYQQAGGPTGRQWVMTSSIPAGVITAFNNIPGGSGWTSPSARTTYFNLARQLRDTYNVPAPTIITALTNAYQAAVLNDHTPPAGG
jgi:hypothetical protein